MIEHSTAYKRRRFPARLIACAVWLYFRFPLSPRLVDELLLERGIVVSYETIRRWAAKFGPATARSWRLQQSQEARRARIVLATPRFGRRSSATDTLPRSSPWRDAPR